MRRGFEPVAGGVFKTLRSGWTNSPPDQIKLSGFPAIEPLSQASAAGVCSGTEIPLKPLSGSPFLIAPTPPSVTHTPVSLMARILVPKEKLPGRSTLETNMLSLSPCQGLRPMPHVSEDQVLQFSLEEVQSTKFCASCTILGRLFTADQITTLELRADLLDAWQLRGQLKVSRTKHGLFEVVLPNEEAKKWALARTPWIIKDKLFTLRPWSPVITKQIYEGMSLALFRSGFGEYRKTVEPHSLGRNSLPLPLGRFSTRASLLVLRRGSILLKFGRLLTLLSLFDHN
ncbi:unnamed protein product [Linum trigynum]|uniref:DUF4283 domain-containing protein n=1 Tax=Linum trigynum TaxID=586398 RepID=A0AAV2E7C4_9ROSI